MRPPAPAHAESARLDLRGRSAKRSTLVEITTLVIALHMTQTD